MKKSTRLIKRFAALFLVVLMSIDGFAAVVSDNDGSAFITKAEFDSIKNDFQSKLNEFNASIDSKIDSTIAKYLSDIVMTEKFATIVPLIRPSESIPIIRYDMNTNLMPASSYMTHSWIYAYFDAQSANGYCIERYFEAMQLSLSDTYDKKNSAYGYCLLPLLNYEAGSGNETISSINSRDYITWDQIICPPVNYRAGNDKAAELAGNHIQEGARTNIIGTTEKEFSFMTTYTNDVKYIDAYNLTWNDGFGAVPCFHQFRYGTGTEKYDYWITNSSNSTNIPIIKMSKDKIKAISVPISSSKYVVVCTGNGSRTTPLVLESCLNYYPYRYIHWATALTKVTNYASGVQWKNAFEYPKYPTEKENVIVKKPLVAFVTATNDKKWSAFDGAPVFKLTGNNDIKDGEFSVKFNTCAAYSRVKLEIYDGKIGSTDTNRVKIKLDGDLSYSDSVNVETGKEVKIFFDKVKKNKFLTFMFTGVNGSNSYPYVKLVGVSDAKVNYETN